MKKCSVDFLAKSIRVDRTEHSRLLGHCSHVEDDEMVLVSRESNTKTGNNQQTGERLRTGVEKKFELMMNVLQTHLVKMETMIHGTYKCKTMSL